MNEYEFDKGMKTLQGMWGRVLKQDAMDIWWGKVQNYHPSDWFKGIEDVILSQRSFPSMGVVAIAVSTHRVRRQAADRPKDEGLHKIQPATAYGNAAHKNIMRMLGGEINYKQAIANLKVLQKIHHADPDPGLTGDLEADRVIVNEYHEWKKKEKERMEREAGLPPGESSAP